MVMDSAPFFLSKQHAVPMWQRASRPLYIVCLIMVIGIIMTGLNVLQLKEMQKEHFKSHGSAPEGSADRGAKLQPIFWVEAKHPDSGYLEHVYKVLQRLGFVRGSRLSDWDLLWHHDYPFMLDEMKPVLRDLQPHQRVNHVPGSGFYTNKVNLATSNITGIPPAFELPAERSAFVRYAEKFTDKMWVQKSNRHRGIKITKASELDLMAENSFIQEYVAKPLLVDGRKFDIGVYTVVASLKPLRVYVLESESLLRFCAQPYEPFDPAILDKYVVGDDYTPVWEIPSLRKYYEQLNYTMRDSLNAHLRSVGMEPQRIWTGIRETIRQVMLEKAKDMQPLGAKYKYLWNFFELSRFDFVLDDQLHVYLMEANMSPNLSSGHFARNALLYEQVLYNLFSLVGVASHVHSTTRAAEADEMQQSHKDIHVDAFQCASQQCTACNTPKCRLCAMCLTPADAEALKSAYREHMHRHNMRRVIPEPIPDNLRHDEMAYSRYVASIPFPLSAADVEMRWWFHAKCRYDAAWCS